MMTKQTTHLFIVFAITVLGLFSCGTEKKEIDTKTQKVTEQVDNSAKTEAIFAEFKTLYSELLEFKGESDFKKFGFGVGGPYNSWLKKVKLLKNNQDSKLLLSKGVVAGELEQLGLTYVSSKGAETETTEFFNTTFSDAINAKPVEEVETASGNANYESIKTNYELFGKWSISVAGQSYQYEIYSKDNELIGVIPSGDYRTQILDKKGNDYFVKGNKQGEFYRIDAMLNMTLFDKDGDLSSVGYKATKQ